MLYFLEQLANIRLQTGAKAKVELLKKYASPSLKDILFYAFSPTVVFGVARLDWDDAAPSKPEHCPTLEEFLVLAKALAARELKGDAAKQEVLAFVNRCPLSYRDLAAGIFTKHLSIGCDAKRINQALPGTIPEFGVQLAELYAPGKITMPAWASKKLDGMRCLAFVKHNSAMLFSRTGKPIDSVPHIVAALKRLPDGVYDGELLHPSGFQATISFCRSKAPKMGCEAVQLHIFDHIPSSDWEKPRIPAHERFAILERLEGQLERWGVTCLQIVEHVKVNSTREFLELHSKYTAAGYEGTMIQWDGPYVRDRGYHLMKYKDVLDSTGKVVGTTPGRGKYRGMIGALVVVESKLGIEVEVAGLTDRQRSMDPAQWIGQVIDFEHQGLTESTPPSFRFPRLLRIRGDYD